MPNGHDREWVRLCLTVNGFRARHRQWPTRLRLDPRSLAVIQDDILTPESFAAVSAKIELVAEKGARFIAEDSEGHRFRYGEDDEEGKPDIDAEEWLGPITQRDEGFDTVKIDDPSGNRVYPKIEPNSVRYIKLGRKGIWEKECQVNGTIIFGYDTGSPVRFPLCVEGKWGSLRESFLEQGHDQRKATSFVNQARRFFDDDGTTLWITFISDRMHWGFLAPTPATRLESGAGVTREVIGGWRSTDMNWKPLTKDRLPDHLTKLAKYPGTSCSVKDADSVVSEINGQRG